MQEKLMYGFLFYMCHFSGVLPLSWKSSKTADSTSSKKNWSAHNSYSTFLHYAVIRKFPIHFYNTVTFLEPIPFYKLGNSFVLSGRGIFWWFLQLAICIFFSYTALNQPIKKTANSLQLHQLIVAIRLIQIFSVISTLFLVIPIHSLRALQICASRAFHIYHLRKIPAPMSASRFFSMMISLTVNFFYLFLRSFQIPTHELFFAYMHSYSYMICAAEEVMISFFIFVAERTYADINSEIKMLSNHSSNAAKLAHLDILVNHHNITSDYVELLKNHFGLHFISIFLWYILRMLSFGLYAVAQMKLGVGVNIIALTFHSCYVTLRLFVLCHHCHRIRQEGEETSSLLRNLQLYSNEELTENQLLMLETYQELVFSRDLQITACDFFNVSIQQVISMLSVLMTYVLVAMQVK